MSYINVNDFISKLESNVPGAKGFEKQRKIDKIYLNAPVNYGRYQVLPFPSVITNFPFIDLPYTREISIPIKNVKSDGTESVYNGWIKLLPMSAYVLKDETGKHLSSSLTAADEQLLQQAYKLHEDLCKELDLKANAVDPVIGKLIRKKNYTLFHAFCVNKWTIDARNPERQNFSALFVATSRKLSEAILDDISQLSLVNSSNDGWLDQVYNRNANGRSGFLMFSVQRNPVNPGFQFGVSHTIDKADYLKNVNIEKEDIDLMSDPVETFLGWQCPKDISNVPYGQRRLFNADIIKKAIDFMSKQLASINIAKQNGTDIKAAICATNEEILKAQTPTNTMGQQTNDPMLAQMADKAASMNTVGQNNIPTNPQSVINKNYEPFTNPPAAHIDPVTSAPVGNNPGFGGGNYQNNGYQGGQQQSTAMPPFTKPAYASGGFGGSENKTDDLPF
jgi:hypothetical protein